MSDRYPWLEILRQAAAEFGEDQSAVECLVELLQAELRRRLRRWQLLEAKAVQLGADLQGAPRLRDMEAQSAAMGHADAQQAVPGFLELMDQDQRESHGHSALAKLLALAAKHGLDDLPSAASASASRARTRVAIDDAEEAIVRAGLGVSAAVRAIRWSEAVGMLAPNNSEQRCMAVHWPWLSRLRATIFQFKHDENKAIECVARIQTELLMRMRLQQELNEQTSDAMLDLRYARFVRDCLQERGVWVDPVPSYVDFMNRVEVGGVNSKCSACFEQLLRLATWHRLEDLHPIINRGQEEVLRMQQQILSGREEVRAIHETTARMEQAIHRSRIAAGMSPESVARLSESGRRRETGEPVGGFTAAEVRDALMVNRPLPPWRRSVAVLQKIMQWQPNACPVVVTGASEFGYGADVGNVVEALGRNLGKFAPLVLLTGTDAAGRGAAQEYVDHCREPRRTLHLLPETPETLVKFPGEMFAGGRDPAEQRQVLGMCARLVVVVGGECEAVGIANAALASEAIVLPIGATKGAAAGVPCQRCQEDTCQIDFALARQRAFGAKTIGSDRWDRITSCDSPPQTAVRVLCQVILESL